MFEYFFPLLVFPLVKLFLRRSFVTLAFQKSPSCELFIHDPRDEVDQRTVTGKLFSAVKFNMGSIARF